MNLNFHRSKLIIFLAISLPLIVVLVFILLQLSFSSPLAENTNCQQTNLPYQDPSLSVDERVTDLLNRMTDAEKI